MASRRKRRKRSVAGRTAEARPSPALGFILHKTAILRRLIERHGNPAISGWYGTPIAEWRVLTHLIGEPPMTATELSTKLTADKAEVSRACRGLLAKGHIKRVPDAADGRSARLSITPSGIVLHNRILPVRQALETELTGALSRTQARALHKALDTLIATLSIRLSEGTPARVPPSKPRRPPARKRPARRAST